MGLRAYLLATVADDLEQEQYSKALLELENMTEVDFVDPVVGSYDIVIMIEAPVSVEAVAREIAAKPWIKDLKILRIVSVFERHRASKRELLKSLRHAGV